MSSPRMGTSQKQIEEETENILEYIKNIFEDALPQSVVKQNKMGEISIPPRVQDQAMALNRLGRAIKQHKQVVANG